MIIPLENTKAAEELFEGWQETIIWSCLQKVMGEIYGDHPQFPKCVMAVLGDFCFLAGEPSRELVRYRPESRKEDFVIMVPQNGQWAQLIKECYKDKAREITRYAIKKDTVFDRERLKAAVCSLPSDYEMGFIDRAGYDLCMAETWSRDLVAQFKDYEMFERLGLGVIAVRKEDGMLVSGASSYSRYLEGIEVEIDTRAEFRRKGLALACGALLILECLERGLYPSWDAHNMGSVRLAEKLGYCMEGEYRGWEVQEEDMTKMKNV